MWTLFFLCLQSRYPNLHLHRLKPCDIGHLYDTDETLPSPALRHGSIKTKRLAEASTAGVGVSVASGVSGEKVRIKEEEEEASDKENISAIPVEKKRKAAVGCEGEREGGREGEGREREGGMDGVREGGREEGGTE
jgi:hypothetical protein